MSTKRYICTGMMPSRSLKMLEIKKGLLNDFKDARLSRQSISMISAMEGFDVWNEFVWEETSPNQPEHEFEMIWKAMRERPE